MGSLNNSEIAVKECAGHSGLRSLSANISWGMRFEECLPRLWTAVGSKWVSTHDRGRFVSPANAKEERPLLAGNCLCFDDYKWQDFLVFSDKDDKSLPCSWFFLRFLRKKPLRATVWFSIEHVRSTSHPTWCIWHHFVLFRGKSLHSRLDQTQQLRSWTHAQAPKQVYRLVFTCSNLIYSSLALDWGTLKETNGCLHWFLSREA